jgi:hypothetical protein
MLVKTDINARSEAVQTSFLRRANIPETDTQKAIEYIRALLAASTAVQYLVGAADPTLTAERVVTDTATISWDLTTPGQAKANLAISPLLGTLGTVDEAITRADGTGGKTAQGSLVTITDAGIMNGATAVGVNAVADTTNRLSVNSAAVLFNHAGATSQVKVNKAATGNTASHLFQVGFSGRAEFGLIGTDDFTLKTSPDGSVFTTALTALNATGALRVGVNLSPAADDGAALGTTALKWSDAFWASGAVLNFNNGDYLITHSADLLAFTGGSQVFGHTALLTYLFEGNSSTPFFQKHGIDGSTNDTITRWSANINPARVVLGKSRGAAVGTRAVVASGDFLGSIYFEGDDGTNFVSGAQISAVVNGTPGTNDMPTDLLFAVAADGAATTTERLRITGAGAIQVTNSTYAQTYLGADGVTVFTMDAGGSSLNNSAAFTVTVPTTGAQKGFQITTPGATASWVSFELALGGTGKPGLILGPGSAVRDTNLYRDSADTWKTDDSFVIAGTLSIGNPAVPVFTNIPQNSQSAAYTLVLGDAQKHILHPTADNNARTFTIPANASVAYPIGTALTFVNQINTVTIAITTDTLTFAGSGATGSRTLAASGIATALKVTATSWIISGTGLT